MRGFVAKPVVVLIVEDEPLICEATADALIESGFEVVSAANADEAVLILEKRSDIGIVFTDIEMPGSMNGLKLTQVIRRRWPPIEVVLTSGNINVPLHEFPEDCLFLPKPYKHQHVVLTLESLTP